MFGIVLYNREKHGDNQRLTFVFKLILMYMVFLEWIQKVVVLPMEYYSFKTRKLFYCIFLKLMWAIFVASLPWCFCNYVIKNGITRRYWQAQLDSGIRLAGVNTECVEIVLIRCANLIHGVLNWGSIIHCSNHVLPHSKGSLLAASQP